MDTGKMIAALDALYGSGRGAKVFTTIMPGILADFDRMLKKAAPGQQVSEEYRLEDGKGSILVTGKRGPGGTSEIDAEIRY